MPSCLCWYTHSTIDAKPCQALFCAWWYASVRRPYNRKGLAPAVMRAGAHACVCVRAGACVYVCGRMCAGVCACACVCACVCGRGGCRAFGGAVRRTHTIHVDPLRTHNSLLFTSYPAPLYPHTTRWNDPCKIPLDRSIYLAYHSDR